MTATMHPMFSYQDVTVTLADQPGDARGHLGPEDVVVVEKRGRAVPVDSEEAAMLVRQVIDAYGPYLTQPFFSTSGKAEWRHLNRFLDRAQMEWSLNYLHRNPDADAIDLPVQAWADPQSKEFPPAIAEKIAIHRAMGSLYPDGPGFGRPSCDTIEAVMQKIPPTLLPGLATFIRLEGRNTFVGHDVLAASLWRSHMDLLPPWAVEYVFLSAVNHYDELPANERKGVEGLLWKIIRDVWHPMHASLANHSVGDSAMLPGDLRKAISDARELICLRADKKRARYETEPGCAPYFHPKCAWR